MSTELWSWKHIDFIHSQCPTTCTLTLLLTTLFTNTEAAAEAALSFRITSGALAAILAEHEIGPRLFKSPSCGAKRYFLISITLTSKNVTIEGFFVGVWENLEKVKYYWFIICSSSRDDPLDGFIFRHPLLNCHIRWQRDAHKTNVDLQLSTNVF